jgi:hypothetical protein
MTKRNEIFARFRQHEIGWGCLKPAGLFAIVSIEYCWVPRPTPGPGSWKDVEGARARSFSFSLSLFTLRFLYNSRAHSHTRGNLFLYLASICHLSSHTFSNITFPLPPISPHVSSLPQPPFLLFYSPVNSKEYYFSTSQRITRVHQMTRQYLRMVTHLTATRCTVSAGHMQKHHRPFRFAVTKLLAATVSRVSCQVGISVLALNALHLR